MKQRLTEDGFRIGFDNSDLLPSYIGIYERLREYETVDAIPVVRCGECKQWNKDGRYCVANGAEWSAHNFCSYGERREM